MASSNYDFEGMWFQIYSKVLKLNEMQKEDALDKSQLREVTTTIFIAKSQRGVVRPTTVNGFQDALIKQVADVSDRAKQKAIYESVLKIINNNHTQEKQEW